MTFAAFETADGRPIELLTFVSGSTVIRYTNVGREVQFGANVFSPVPFRSSDPIVSKDSDDSQVKIQLPRTATVLALWNGQYGSNVTTVTIERFHNNDPDQQLQVHFKGQVASVAKEGPRYVMLVLPFQAGNFIVPRANFGALCSSFLYDTPGCSLTRDNFRYVTTITSITNDVEIGFTGLRARAATLDAGINGLLSSAELDGYWLGGYIATDDGEVREIMEGPFGGDPDVVRILQPFRDVSVGEACTVFAGCLFDIDICNRKFDNAINFRGWPYVPEVDPGNTELPPGSRTSSGNF